VAITFTKPHTNSGTKTNFNTGFDVDLGYTLVTGDIGDLLVVEFSGAMGAGFTMTPPDSQWGIGTPGSPDNEKINVSEGVQIFGRVVDSGMVGSHLFHFVESGGAYVAWGITQVHPSASASWTRDRHVATNMSVSQATWNVDGGTTTSSDEIVFCTAGFNSTTPASLGIVRPGSHTVTNVWPEVTAGTRTLWGGTDTLSATTDLGNGTTHTVFSWTGATNTGSFMVTSYAAVATTTSVTGTVAVTLDAFTSTAAGSAVSAFWTAGSSGSYTIEAVADSTDAVAELDETNNTFDITVNVGSAPVALPDLTPTAITWTPTSPTEGDAVLPTVTVANQGSGALASGSDLRVAVLLDNGDSTTYRAANVVGWLSPGYTSGIAAGASVSLPMTGSPAGPATFTAPAAGTHELRAIVDSPSLLVESDKTNQWYGPVSFVTAAASTPSGGTIPGTREAQYWGGAQTMAANLPFGDGVTFNTSHSINWGSVSEWLQTNRYGMTIEGTSYTNIEPPCVCGSNQEGHRSWMLGPNATTFYDSYGCTNCGNFQTYGAGGSGTTTGISLKNFSGNGGMIFTNMGASGWAHWIGLIRQKDVEQGYIGHALSVEFPNAELNKTTTFVWPAYRADGDAASSYGTGPGSIGMRVGIPWSTAALGCTSTLGVLMEQALRIYGGYVDNRAGNGFVKLESTSYMQTRASECLNSGDSAKLRAAIRLCTNCNSTNPAGPVVTARRALLAPPFAY
jgi:hypothetical protein